MSVQDLYAKFNGGQVDQGLYKARAAELRDGFAQLCEQEVNKFKPWCWICWCWILACHGQVLTMTSYLSRFLWQLACYTILQHGAGHIAS
jgi:hypothetical protein